MEADWIQTCVFWPCDGPVVGSRRVEEDLEGPNNRTVLQGFSPFEADGAALSRPEDVLIKTE